MVFFATASYPGSEKMPCVILSKASRQRNSWMKHGLGASHSGYDCLCGSCQDVVLRPSGKTLGDKCCKILTCPGECLLKWTFVSQHLLHEKDT